MRSALALAFALLPAAVVAKPTQPYMLVIQGTQPVTLSYPSEKACLAAKAKILSQFNPTQYLPNGGVIISTPPTVFCVPR